MNDEPRDAWAEWRDRIFGVLLPIFLGVLVYNDLNDNGTLDNELLLVFLGAFASGVGGALMKKLLK